MELKPSLLVTIENRSHFLSYVKQPCYRPVHPVGQILWGVPMLQQQVVSTLSPTWHQWVPGQALGFFQLQ